LGLLKKYDAKTADINPTHNFFLECSRSGFCISPYIFAKKNDMLYTVKKY